MIDAHIHIDLYPEPERGAMLDEAFTSGLQAVIAVSMHLESCKVNRELKQRYGGRVITAYGYHPEQPLPDEAELDSLYNWIRERHGEGERFAIGEVGLPYYSRTEAEAAGRLFDEAPYEALLERFVALAAELDLAVVLHAVYEDADKACALLEKYEVQRAHFHWFKGAPETVERMIARGYRISVTPDVAYEPEIQAIVRRYPLELMMAETDGPWPFEGPYEGKRTHPLMVKDVVAKIAELKGVAFPAAAEQIRSNTELLYKI
ncbi:TatD family hydrolase [Paenibacillus abyssi]|uniref:DNAase n=1 Tax=Paenibacillus abyssi TaxID=1340531 RepID=A0A917D762_9BACL|nr:TatD family hydrolase [Paenibacillus abyssi]GGG12753.1 hypothetical protein GCM10010916_32090 [Paenibacillus abyssi]